VRPTASPAPSRLLFLCALPFFAGACAPEGRRSAESFEADARLAAANYEFEQAMALYDSARTVDPIRVSAQQGFARQAAALHLYDAAIPAYEQVLEMTPESVIAWEEYVNSLVSGGIYWGDRRWMERALDRAPQSLRHSPTVETIGALERAAGELGAHAQWVGILAEFGPETVSGRIEHALAKARIAAAAASGREAEVDAWRDSLRTSLDLLELKIGDGPYGAERGDDLYRLAAGYGLLADSAKSKPWLARLEATPESAVLTSSLSYWSRLRPVFRTDSVEQRLAMFSGPDWTLDGVAKASALLGMRGGVLPSLVDPAHEPRSRSRIPATPDEPPSPLADATVPDQILANGVQALRLETSGRAGAVWSLVTSLLYFGHHQDAALALIDEAIAGLEADAPRWLYAGAIRREREESRTRMLSWLQATRGRALEQLGRYDEADVASVRSVTIERSGRSLAYRGVHLLRRREFEAAFEVLVDALAFGVEEDSKENLTRLAELASAELGRPATYVDVVLAERRPAIEAERETRILGARLDEPAPDFELEDRDGRLWRLDELEGRVVVLTYWAMWCGPCIAEFPYYRDLLTTYADDGDVVFLSISTDVDRVEAERFLDEQGYDFTVLFDNGSGTDFDVKAIPVTIFIDPEGKVQYRLTGFSPDRYVDDMDLRIDALRPGLGSGVG